MPDSKKPDEKTSGSDRLAELKSKVLEADKATDEMLRRSDSSTKKWG